MDIEVKGHSGCRVDVMQEGRDIFVYKSTSDPKYLERLALQARKQMAAAGVEYQHIRVPKIYELKTTEESTIIKMQYVYSKNFIEFFEQAGFEQVKYLIVALESFIDYEVRHSEMKTVPSSVFQEKFKSVRSHISTANEELTAILDASEKLFSSMGDMEIPVGLCHGDLTFSNILFNGNNYYLIDFLDSFIESPLQDIVKIRQDTAFYWSQLMYTRNFDAIRLKIILDKIDSEIDAWFAGKYEWYKCNYKQLQLMNLLRILPYAKEEKVVSHLKKSIGGLLNEI